MRRRFEWSTPRRGNRAVRRKGALSQKAKRRRNKRTFKRLDSAREKEISERSNDSARRKKIKNANRRKNAISTVARLGTATERASKRRRFKARRRFGDASLFLLAQRKNAQRGDASGAEDEDNIHQRVRLAERNTGGEIKEKNKENERRKGNRSDAKEFGHIAVPKGLRR